MYRANLVAGASLQAPPSGAYNFGTGDFTVMAMVSTLGGGTAVARKGTVGGSQGGGFLLVINPDGSVKFATDDGYTYFQAVSGPSSVIDGECHTVAGVRSGANLYVLIDGATVPVTVSGNPEVPLNVNNALPLTMGDTQQSQEPHNQFLGGLMNVSLWNVALTGDRLVGAAFGRVNPEDPNLAGLWTLDNTTADISSHQNSAQIVGAVTFEYCLHCMWASGDNVYEFCSVSNMPGADVPETAVTLARDIVVPEGVQSFGMGILANQDTPAFPEGVQVILTDPNGRLYDQDTNTETEFILTKNGQPWSVVVINPVVGKWTVRVTASSKMGFHLFAQTVPTAQVVQTCEQTLAPLYPAGSGHSRALVTPAGVEASLTWSFWTTVAAVGVAVAAVAVIAAVTVGTGGAATPSVSYAVAEFAGLAVAEVATMMDGGSFNTDSVPIISEQTGGMAGLLVAPGQLILMDANVADDQATNIIYRQRSKKLYPAVVASPFNTVQKQLVGDQMKRPQVADALSGFSIGYVSAGGHGMETYLMGWYADGNSGPLDEVLATTGTQRFAPQEVQGRIFHFFACRTGAAGTDTSPGLGRAMVSAGAVAFFGYNVPVIIDVANSPAFCWCDIQIDLAMIAGKTCGQAYSDAIAMYDSTISRLQADGDMQAAARLAGNRNALVAPATNAMYGNNDAFLQLSC